MDNYTDSEGYKFITIHYGLWLLFEVLPTLNKVFTHFFTYYPL